MKPFLCLILMSSITSADWTWHVVPETSVELRGPNGPAARFLIDPAPADPHFDLLASPAGDNLVWVAPPDHLWHYGQWFSWKFINGVNFWETNKETGRSMGITKVSDPDVETTETTATIRYTRHYHLPGQADPVLKDNFTITILAPSNKRCGPTVNWSITTTALTDVTLDRTPLTGEPNGQSWGGYCGMSWRGSKALTGVSFTTNHGPLEVKENHSIIHQTASWVTATGTIDKQPAALTFFDHPQNPGYPNTFYLFATPKLPFWYINPSLVLKQPITLKAGELLNHRYRLVTHDGTLDPSDTQW